MDFNLLTFMVTLLIILRFGTSIHEEDWSFPDGFLIGSASASYQVEGGWNVSDKGENIWDWFTHHHSMNIVDQSNGDLACDSYHKYKEDVEILHDIGFDFYRFSISWSRIFPTGFANKISKDGVQYYHNLIDELLSKGLEPFVTIYHWDHPQVLEELGGWTNELIVDWFGDYARVIFREFGPKVKYFATINEPQSFCIGGYGSTWKAPAKNVTYIGEYLCMHNVLKAHARAYHIYNNEFRAEQRGKIGIVNPCGFVFPDKSNNPNISDLGFQFECGWISHPIFSKKGNYPSVMIERIGENSKLQGWPRSRLPEFTKAEIDYIRGTADYYGLNHYTSKIGVQVTKKPGEEWLNDRGYYEIVDSKWPESASSWLKVVPEGFRQVLLKIKSEYGNPPVYVLECGFSDKGEIKDSGRLNYYYLYIKELLLSLKDGCNVRGFTGWSIIDNFEWLQGYTERFGLVKVDFTDPRRKRTYKNSAKWFKDVLRLRKLIAIDNYLK